VATAVRPAAAEPSLSADDLVRRAREGDEAAFETLYRTHVGRVHALCLRMTGDAAHARELTQDAFVRAWEKLDSFRGESAFGSWLHRLAVNVVLMDRRLAARRAEDALPDEAGEAAPPSPPASLHQAAPRHADRMDLEAAIAALPLMARQVLVLHELEGYDHGEIAAMLRIAEGTSKAHLFRARRILRGKLEP
jgi:RNA polymerase sigma factor (sigma-70 family)